MEDNTVSECIHTVAVTYFTTVQMQSKLVQMRNKLRMIPQEYQFIKIKKQSKSICIVSPVHVPELTNIKQSEYSSFL